MASPAVLDIENLLAPIAGEAPCGRDPRSDMASSAPFVIVKDAYDLAREAERLLERSFERPEEANQARQRMLRNWAIVCQRGPEIIGAVGKDLRVAVWLTEALLRQNRLGGLRDGLLLAAGLVERYWDGAFPQPEPETDDPEDDPRSFTFTVLAGSARECRLAPSLRKLALSDGGKDDPVSLWEYQECERSGASNALAAIEERVQQSAREFKRDLVEDAEACIAAADALEAVLDARCGNKAPSFAGLRELVDQAAALVRPHVEADVLVEIDPSAMADTPESSEVSVGHTPPRPPAGGLDRQSAFRQLEEIAAFFRRTEPHSPIAYALENIVRRGRMSLPELMRELISDEGARQNYFVVAGMQPPDKSA